MPAAHSTIIDAVASDAEFVGYLPDRQRGHDRAIGLRDACGAARLGGSGGVARGGTVGGMAWYSIVRRSNSCAACATAAPIGCAPSAILANNSTPAIADVGSDREGRWTRNQTKI